MTDAGRSAADRAARLALGRAGLWERVAEADPGRAACRVRDIAYGGMWFVVRLEDGTCGRAFAFTGAHEVYGPFDVAAFEHMRRLVGMGAAQAFGWLEGEEARCLLGASVAASLSLAVLNAAAAPSNKPFALERRGFRLVGNCVDELVRADDRVVVVGSGMFRRELCALCPRVDIVDLRPACDLVGAHVGGDGVRFEPGNAVFHTDPADNPALFAAADVLFITGSTLANGTFFDLMALPRRAREVVLFGPSAAGPFGALAELGVTCVSSSYVVDGELLVAATLKGIESRQMPREMTCSYTVCTAHADFDMPVF